MATYYRWTKYSLDASVEIKGTSSEYSIGGGGAASTRFYFRCANSYEIDGMDFSLISPQDIVLRPGESQTISYKYVAFSENSQFIYTAANSNASLIISVRTSSSRNSMIVSATAGNINQLCVHRDNYGYVYSTSSTAYPNGGVSGNYYYDHRTTVSSPVMTAPDYPNPITTQTVTVTWEEGTSNVPSAPIDHYEFFWDNGSGNGSVNVGNVTSYQFNIPAGTTSIQFGIKAVDTNGYGTLAWGSTVVVHTSPTLTVPQMVMQGQSATVSWTAVEGADSYTLQRKANTDADWTQVYSGAALTFSETVGTWTSLQYRVCAVFGSTNGGWATSGDIQIVSASALVISGSDGDLGILTNDVQYSISSDQTSPTIDVTVEANGGEYASFQATSGQTYSVSVLDLPTGTGSIVITATTEVSSSPVTVTRTWTYSKTAPTFPESGSVADLTQQGKTIWAKTIAEAVRTPGIWGGNLGLALQKLAKAMLFDPDSGAVEDISGGTIPMVSIETGSYVGTGTQGSSNPNKITSTSGGIPIMVWVTSNSENGTTLPMIRPSTKALSGTASSENDLIVAWEDNGVSWYGSNSVIQMNTPKITFYYTMLKILGGDAK